MREPIRTYYRKSWLHAGGGTSFWSLIRKRTIPGFSSSARQASLSPVLSKLAFLPVLHSKAQETVKQHANYNILSRDHITNVTQGEWIGKLQKHSVLQSEIFCFSSDPQEYDDHKGVAKVYEILLQSSLNVHEYWLFVNVEQYVLAMKLSVTKFCFTMYSQ